MRRPLLLLFFLFGCTTDALSTGCAAFYHLDDYTTSDAKPGADTTTTPPGALDGAAAPSSGPQPGTVDAGPLCTVNADCMHHVAGGALTAPSSPTNVPTVCLKATGTCVPLVTADCPRVYGNYASDSAVVVGMVLSGTDGDADITLEKAAVLASEEINSATSGGGLPKATPTGAARPLVLVGCDASANVVRATRHLVEDLRVPAIVGPTSGDDVVDVTQQVSTKGGTLLMTPTSRASSISQLADDDLTWRVVSSDTQRAKLVIQQMSDLETTLRATRSLTTVKLGVVHRTDQLGLSARDSISGTLILNGRFISDAANAGNVSIDAYSDQPGIASPLASIVTKYATAFLPDLVFITAPEQVTDLIVPLEAAFTAARVVNRPYYVCTDSAKTQAFLDAIASASLPADIRRRVRGVGVKADTGSAPVYDAFTSVFTARYGVAPRPFAAALSYDAMYAIAYGIAASADQPLSGTSVAHGLRALGVGDVYSVGVTPAGQIMKNLAAGKSVSLRGTSSVMQWNAAGDIAGGTAEVWCLGAAATPAFGSAGLTIDVQTQVIGGAFVQCR